MKLSGYFDRLSDEDKIFASHILDMADICDIKFIPRFSAFLDIRQAKIAEEALNSICYERYMFYGGFEQASRVMLGVFPMYSELSTDDFPMDSIVIRYREADKLSHRDFLGAFMNCGINRNMLGDIIVNDGYTVVFASNTVSGAICSEISKIGSVGVKISIENSPEILIKESFSEINGTVSSLRLDSIVSTAVKLSREKAAQLIRGGNVALNCSHDISVSDEVKVGDIFSVRGYGKFILCEISGRTKRDRLHIIIKKYI